MHSECGTVLDGAAPARFLRAPMLTGLVYTLCRLLAAFVCLLSVSEAFAVSFSAASFSAESEWRTTSPAEPSDTGTPLQDAREEREEREGEGDDHDDDIDGSRHAAWVSSAQLTFGTARAPFPRALIEDAPDKSHHSLDPKPPRRS